MKRMPTPTRFGVLLVFLVSWNMAAYGQTVSVRNVELVAGDSTSDANAVGEYSSFVHDPAGGQHIVYYDGTLGALKCAHRAAEGTRWIIEVLDDEGDAGRYADVAIMPGPSTASGTASADTGQTTVTLTGGDAIDNVYLGGRFEFTGDGVDYAIVDIDTDLNRIELAEPYVGATKANAAFTVENYRPVISYQGGSAGRTLNLIKPDSNGVLAREVVDPMIGDGFAGFHSKIAVDGDGAIHIVHQDQSALATNGSNLRYALYDGGWIRQTVMAARRIEGSMDLFIDGNGLPWVIARDSDAGEVLAFVRSGMVWAESLIDATENAGHALDAAYFAEGDKIFVSGQVLNPEDFDDEEIIVYTGDDTDALPTWTGTEAADENFWGDYTSIVHGVTSGTQQVAFHDAGLGRLLLTRYRPAPPGYSTPEVLDDSTGDVGRYVSADLNPLDGALHAAYYDAGGEALKIVRSDGVTTPTQEFIDGSRVGSFSAIGLTSTDVVVAYHHDSEGELRVARWPRGGIPAAGTDELVDDSSGDVGEYVAMAIDPMDRIYLVYYDRPGRNLRLAAYDGTQWFTGVLAGNSGRDVGEYCDLAINATGDELALCYYDEDNQALQYRIAPVPSTIDADLDFGFTGGVLGDGLGWGRFASITYGAGNDLHLAFYDADELNPRYARIEGSTNTELIEDSLFQVTGWAYTSIAYNPADGRPAVAYHDVTNGALKYAERVGGEVFWETTTIDSVGDTGYYPQLIFDEPANQVFIVYYNQGEGELRIVFRELDETEWSRSIVLLEQTRGARPSLTFEDDGRLLSSFHHVSAGDLLVLTTKQAPNVNRVQSNWNLYR